MKWIEMKLSLHLQFVIVFITLITLSLGVFGIRYYFVSTKVIQDVVEKNMYQIVKKSNENMDTKLSLYFQNAVAFSSDKELYQAYSNVIMNEEESINSADKIISKLINKYFSHFSDIYSVQVATSYFTYGPTSNNVGEYGKSFIPSGSFSTSLLYKIARENKGKYVWVPTYRFVDMFSLPELKEATLDYHHLFSFVHMMDGAITDGSIFQKLPDGLEEPVVIVNFKEEFFHHLLGENIPYNDSIFMVVNQDGKVISSSDPSKITTQLNISWINTVIQSDSGFEIMNIDGKKMIVSFDKSTMTGWTSVIAFPYKQLVGPIASALFSYFLYSALIIALIAYITTYIISRRMTNPINKLIQGVKMTGRGEFGLRIEEKGSYEFRILSHNFNLMNERIAQLINENYVSKIKERDTEINALNLQLNPHFMYNTLNLINMVAMENDQDEISEMIVNLSNMLRYTVKNKNRLVRFQDDFEYLQSYINIMSKRFGGIINVAVLIQPEIMNTYVPQFLLQPFVENSFLHGFKKTVRGGILKIYASVDNNTTIFIVQDNGCGFSSEMLKEIHKNTGKSLGMNNVLRRLELIFGDKFNFYIESSLYEGTKITIQLPLTT